MCASLNRLSETSSRGPLFISGIRGECTSREEEIVKLKNSNLKKGSFLLPMKIVYIVNRRYPDLSSEEWRVRKIVEGNFF